MAEANPAGTVKSNHVIIQIEEVVLEIKMYYGLRRFLPINFLSALVRYGSGQIFASNNTMLIEAILVYLFECLSCLQCVNLLRNNYQAA